MTQVEICNLALAHIGQNPITSITDVTPEAKACNRFWEPLRDDAFREFMWSFNSVSFTLTPSTDVDEDSIPGWTYFYDYPTYSIATIWYVYDESTATTKHENNFEVKYDLTTASSVICCDLDDAYVDASYIMEDPESWDHKFAKAFSYKLASSIAKILTGDEDLGLKLLNIYNAIIWDAKRVASHEKNKKPTQTNRYLESR